MKHIGCILKDIYFQKKKGQLIFRHSNIQKRLFFQDGFLVDAKTNHPQELLGEVLFKLGKLNGDVYSQLEDHIEPKKNIGEILIKNGLISENDLLDGLAFQMREVTLNIFPYFDGKFRFLEKKNFVEQEFDVKINILDLIESGIRQMKYNPFLKEFMKHNALFPKTQHLVPHLTEEEKEIFEKIQENASVEAILRDSSFEPEFFWKSMYLFYCMNLIDFRSEKKISSIEDTPEKMTEEDTNKNLERVLELNKYLSAMNYYQILGISPTSSQEDIKKAYFHLARKYHPDRFDRNLPPETIKSIEDVFDKISKSYHTLSNEEKRRDYDSKYDPKTKEEKIAPEKLANIKFRQGKTLYNQGKYGDAMVLLEEAIKLSSKKGSYFLLLAMIESKIPSTQKKAEEDFLKAIELEPWNPEGHVGLGLLYKRAGLRVKAEKHLNKALTLDPEHKVAQKELAQTSNKKKGLKEILSTDIFGKKK